MMVDYKAIADDAAANGETDYAVAFARMSAETVTEAKPSAKVTEAMVLSGLGLTAGATLIAQLEAVLPEVAIRVLRAEGIDVADAESQAQIGALRPTIGDVAADWLLAQAVETRQKWPGLKPGHVQNALEGVR